MSRADLQDKLDRLAAESDEFGVILRAKGMVPSAEDAHVWYYFDVVPGEAEIREGEPDFTGKVCVIGSELKEDVLDKEFKG